MESMKSMIMIPTRVRSLSGNHSGGKRHSQQSNRYRRCLKEQSISEFISFAFYQIEEVIP